MMSDLDALYRDVILDHNRRPRNFQALEAGRSAEGHNPLCGDRLTVYVQIEDDVIKRATFHGFGCAIATASASLMTEGLEGRSVGEAEALFERFERMVTAPAWAPVEDLGPLSALAGVRHFPVRVKCATLAWRTFRAAAARDGEVVSTE